METLGTIIRKFREARDLSLQDLADLCECSKAHLWELEQGKSSNPTIQVLAKLADALWLDLGALAHVAAQPWRKGAIITTNAGVGALSGETR